MAERLQRFDGNGALPKRAEPVRDPLEARTFALKGGAGNSWPDEQQESPQALRRCAKEMDCRGADTLRPACTTERVADQGAGNVPDTR